MILACIGAAVVWTGLFQLAHTFTAEEVAVEEVAPTAVEFEVLLVGNKYNRHTRTVELGVVTLPATMFVEEEYLEVLMQGSTWGVMTPREEQ